MVLRQLGMNQREKESQTSRKWSFSRNCLEIVSQERTIKLTVGQEEYVKEDHSQQDSVNMRAIMEINEAFISYTYKDVTTIYPYQWVFFSQK